jgi:phosphate transport system permease protein
MQRVTSPRVRMIDAFSRVFITTGGIAIIAAVLAIMAYLLLNVVPLFRSGHLGVAQRVSVKLTGDPVVMSIDEYRGAALFMYGDGRWQSASLADGALSPVQTFVPEGRKVTAISELNDAGRLAVGLDDGSVQLVEFGFATDFLGAGEVTEQYKALPSGGRVALATGGFVEMTGMRQARRTAPRVVAAAPVALPEGTGAVERVDFRSSSGAQYLAAMRADGTLVFNSVSITTPLGGGRPRTRLSSETVPYSAPQGLSKLPVYLLAKDDGTQVAAIWADGTVQRYAKPIGGTFSLAETVRVLEPGAQLTQARMLLGSKTIIFGDQRGGVLGGFGARTETVRTPDGVEFKIAHRYETGAQQPVTALGISMRDRCFVVGDGAGNLTVWHMMSGKRVVDAPGALKAPVKLAIVAPKLDGVHAIDAAGNLVSMDFEPGHPEASVRALFGKVWYEGDAGPQYTYQASTGEDTAETKYSKVPLIFGTIKATLYAMLFAVPIAICAALYTSEFLHPRVKNTVKPVIEMMASLPSVVLGFLAAIVIAPLFRDILPGVMVALIAIPLTVLTAAYLWQLLPVRITAALTSLQHVSMVLALVLVSGLASVGVGRMAERALFRPTPSDVLVRAGAVTPVPREQWPEALRDKRAFSAQEVRPFRPAGFYYREGQIVKPDLARANDAQVLATIERDGLDKADLRLWLDGVIGGPLPGWLVVLLAHGLIVASLLRARLLDPLVYASFPQTRTGPIAAVAELGKFFATVCAGALLALGAGWLLSALGMDARDAVLGTYSQRNTLVVGLVMGFAIIPIIYTISEDALSAVPGQLRSASLGCGATRWQTATRVVLPIALSGIFSAVMIGLGRAAGETMIVLMATGNTPDMDWNLFSGFRTLAANIAVEMPEAPRDGTHYRVLFLGALCLFVLTFVVNTVAEYVRIKVRKRSAAL